MRVRLIGHSCELCAVRAPLCEFWFYSEREPHARAQGWFEFQRPLDQRFRLLDAPQMRQCRGL
jgi:hypothetical protein